MTRMQFDLTDEQRGIYDAAFRYAEKSCTRSLPGWTTRIGIRPT
jgi:hypothetical protein